MAPGCAQPRAGEAEGKPRVGCISDRGSSELCYVGTVTGPEGMIWSEGKGSVPEGDGHGTALQEVFGHCSQTQGLGLCGTLWSWGWTLRVPSN